MGLYQIRSFCLTEETWDKIQRHLTEWEKLFAHNVSDIELISKIHKTQRFSNIIISFFIKQGEEQTFQRQVDIWKKYLPSEKSKLRQWNVISQISKRWETICSGRDTMKRGTLIHYWWECSLDNSIQTTTCGSWIEPISWNIPAVHHGWGLLLPLWHWNGECHKHSRSSHVLSSCVAIQVIGQGTFSDIAWTTSLLTLTGELQIERPRGTSTSLFLYHRSWCVSISLHGLCWWGEWVKPEPRIWDPLPHHPGHHLVSLSSSSIL